MTESVSPSARSGYFHRHWAWWFTVAVLVLVAVVRIRLLNYPLERDEGEYAYAGQLMLQGIPPYELAYNMKFPGTYAAYAFIMALFGQTPAGIHVGLMCMTTLTALMLYWLGKKMLDPIAGMVAATFYAVQSASPLMLGLSGHATHFAAFFATAGLCLMWKTRQNVNWPTAASAGFMFGAAILMKQHAMFICAWAAIAFTWDCWRNVQVPTSKRLWNIISFCVGAAMPLGICCLLLWHAGVFGKFWFWTIDYARQYVSVLSVSTAGLRLWSQLCFISSKDYLIWMIGIAGLGLIWFDKRANKMRLWLLGFAAASTLTTVPGFYFREHYFLLTLPAMALLAGCAVSGTHQLWKQRAGVSRIKDWPVWGYALVLTLIILVRGVTWFILPPAQASIAIYGGNLFFEAEIAAAYIQDHSTSDTRVAVLGSEPEIYFLSHVHSATGYIYTYALMEPQTFAPQMQDEMISEIERASPEFIVFANLNNSWLRRPTSDPKIFNWWASYRTNYTTIGFLDTDPPVEIPGIWGGEARLFAKTHDDGLWVYERNKPSSNSAAPQN
ncbi:MAG TPA: glycosyltransferase family 39 protein [Methylomirabilota bacterium]|nr:glycosyltransferase family 39 protein [Methylomirabilota bacterium]